MIRCNDLEINARIDEIPVLINFIGNTMLEFDLNQDDQFQIQLAVEEAVSNIIFHGDLSEYDKINIRCQRKDNKIDIIIMDHGKPFDPREAANPDLKTSPLKRKPGGLGVYFIKRYMNKINYEFKNGKNILTLIKEI